MEGKKVRHGNGVYLTYNSLYEEDRKTDDYFLSLAFDFTFRHL